MAEEWRRNIENNLDTPLEGPRGGWWWTGRRPLAGACPGCDESGVLGSLPAPDLRACTAPQVQAYFDNTWALTEVLFSSLQGAEAFYRPPYHQLRHPLIFYYGHPAALYVNKLRVAGLLDTPINARFERIFETGVDEMSWDDLSKNDMPWPTVREVNAYRRVVHRAVSDAIARVFPAEGPGRGVDPRSPEWALFMGFEHERIHLETSSVLIRELPPHLVSRPAEWPAHHPTSTPSESPHDPQVGRDFPANDMVFCAGGTVELGKPKDFPSYGWDNEYGRRVAEVRSFHAGRFLVSNGDFLAFERRGGYQERRYWTDEGWRWRCFRNARWPAFWVPDGPAGLHHYRLRTCFEVVEMPWSWPAVVNFEEARAYCMWRTEQEAAEHPFRLITEAEHWCIRDASCRDHSAGTKQDPIMLGNGHRLESRSFSNLNLAFGSEAPVDAHAATSEGFHDTAGNVWEWCEDHFNPLPGFDAHRIYDDFSSPCFDGAHQMILGGSFVSTGAQASIWARFHFRPHFFQHTGFRLVVGEGGACDAVKLNCAASQAYESKTVLSEYLVLHYASTTDAMPYTFGPREALEYPRRCVELMMDAARSFRIEPRRALDIGCNVGGASFELARVCEEVLGVDVSAASIAAATALARHGSLPYELKIEGDIVEPRTAVVDPAIVRSRVRFQQADACNLPAELEGFDLVLGCNLLCRLPSPSACLSRMGGQHGLVRPGGILLLTSPYSWMEQFTPRSAWFGGNVEEGAPRQSREAVIAFLEPEFELVRELDLPLLIREHARKYQYIVAHATVWRRRSD